MSISEHEAKTLADFEMYETELAALRARVAELEVELDAARRVIETNGQLVSHEARALTAERELDLARGLIARLGDADALESLNVLLTHERVRVADLERERDESARNAQDRIGMGKRLYESILKAVAPHFPKDSRELEWDVLPRTLGGLAADAARLREALEALASALGLVPEPMTGGRIYAPHMVKDNGALGRSILSAALASAPSAEPTPRDIYMRIAEAVRKACADSLFAATPLASGSIDVVRDIDLAAVVAKAVGT